MSHKTDRPGRHVVIVNGGPPPSPRVAGVLAPADVVLGVDGGYAHAELLSLRCDELIGDFDSLDETLLARAQAQGVSVSRFDVDKDATDLELALMRAHDLLADSITVICGEGWGDRFDHLAAQLGLLANPFFAHISVRAWFGEAYVAAVHDGGSATLFGVPGQMISLLAVGADVTGVHTSGLRFPLDHETLSPYSTRSVSNEFHTTSATVRIGRGSLLVIVPDALSNARPG